MKKYFAKTTIVPFMIFLMAGCSEKEVVEVGLSGTLTGTITSYDNGDATEQAGVKITIEGTSPEITATTDDKGKFVVDNLKTGTYDLVITRSGYGTYKIIGYSFVGGEAPSAIIAYIYKLPEFTIADFQLSMEEYYYQRLRGTVYIDLPDQAQDHGGYVRYYLSKSKDVSPYNYMETGTFYIYSNSATGYFSKQIRTDLFPPGSTIYAVAYPCRENYLSYVDLETGNLIYSSIGPKGSDVSSIKVPVE